MADVERQTATPYVKVQTEQVEEKHPSKSTPVWDHSLINLTPVVRSSHAYKWSWHEKHNVNLLLARD